MDYLKGFSKSCFCILFSAVILMLFLVENGFAEAKFSFKPRVSASAGYDSNFYLSEENEREVYTYLIQPGIGLGIESPKAKLTLDYTLEAYFFDDKSEVPEGENPADDENYIGHIFIFDGQYNLFERLALSLNDSFYYTRRPVESDQFSNSIARDKYWVNRFTPGIFYNFNDRFSAGLRYRRTDLKYVDDDAGGSDFLEHRILANLIYNPSRTLTLDLDYQRWTNTETAQNLEEKDYTSDQLQLVLEKRFTYLAVAGGIGYHNRSYEDAEFEDEDSLIYKASATWQNPPPEDITRYRGSSFQRAKTHAYLAYEKNFNNLGYFFDTYTAERLTGSAGYVFFDKIHLLARGYYQITDYKQFTGLTPEGSTELREDKTYDISASLGYLIRKNMEILFRVGNQNRDSNLAGYDYDNLYSMLEFNFNFDVTARGPFSEEASYYR